MGFVSFKMRIGDNRWGMPIIGAFVLLNFLGVHAEDWPQFRGAERDAVWRETGIMQKFPESGLHVRWRVDDGPGWASPVVAAGRVYIFDSVLEKPKARERLRCLNEKTGKVLWEHAVEVAYPDWAFSPGNGPIPTPIVHEGRVYSLGMMADLFCLDAATGTELWRRNLATDYKVTGFTPGASPFVEGNRLILAVGGKPDAGLIALDKVTGKEIWHALDETSGNSSPIIIAAGGVRQLIFWSQQSVSSVDPANGKLWWRERLLTSSDSAVAAPVSDGHLLLIGGLMFGLDAEKPGARVLWPDSRSLTKRILSNTSTAILRGGYVYSARTNGELVCLDAKTGQQVWNADNITDKRSSTGASIHLTPQGNSVLLFTDKGELIRAELTPQGYHEISRTLLIAPTYQFGGHNVTWSPPAFANGAVFVRNEKELICADLRQE
jgi:outer membrane protein assembly factor BamB